MPSLDYVAHGGVLRTFSNRSASGRASGVVRQGRRHGLSITYKIIPCWVTLHQPAMRDAVFDQPSNLRTHCIYSYNFLTQNSCADRNMATTKETLKALWAGRGMGGGEGWPAWFIMTVCRMLHNFGTDLINIGCVLTVKLSRTEFHMDPTLLREILVFKITGSRDRLKIFWQKWIA